MTKQTVFPENAPKAVGPYSPAVTANGFVFVSGQIPIDPVSGTIITESFEAQVRQTLKNLKTVIEGSGSSLMDVVKVNIFLKDINHFVELNSIYEEYFMESKPARACVEVSNLPKGVDVEIDAIALISK